MRRGISFSVRRTTWEGVFENLAWLTFLCTQRTIFGAVAMEPVRLTSYKASIEPRRGAQESALVSVLIAPQYKPA